MSSQGPTTAQALTQIVLGGATVLLVLGVPIALFVHATETGAESRGGLLGLLGFAAIAAGGLLLVFVVPRFAAPSIPTYRAGALERSPVNITTGSPNDGTYARSSRSEWTPWVVAGLLVWGVGLALSFAG